jgi:hypothetical protein
MRFSDKLSLESTGFTNLAHLITEAYQFAMSGDSGELSPEAYALAKRFCMRQDEKRANAEKQ